MNMRFIALCLAIIPLMIFAEEPEQDRPSVVDDILADSANIIIQDEFLESILEYAPIKKQDKRAANIGYRVQVFSDNNVRTARNEARTKQRNIMSRFPQYDSYVTYNSPYWRLRVGDFKTMEEANAALAAIRRAFPAYARELRVVRDRIKLSKE